MARVGAAARPACLHMNVLVAARPAPDEVELSEPLLISRPGGFVPLGAGCRRVAPLMMQFPPFGGGEAATGGGVVAKVQTHWVKTAKNRRFWRNGSALWRNRWVRVHRLIDTALRDIMLAEVRRAGPSYWQ